MLHDHANASVYTMGPIVVSRENLTMYVKFTSRKGLKLIEWGLLPLSTYMVLSWRSVLLAWNPEMKTADLRQVTD